MTPTTWRESIACGVEFSPCWRIASAIPGTS